MSDLGQDTVGSVISHAWNFFKQESEVRKIKAMTPAELATWRQEELQRIHDQAVRTASIHSERELRKLGTTRADSIRKYEVLLRNERGVLLSQYLLEGMDVRGLDMSKFRDQTTKLPPDVVMPPTWQAPAAIGRTVTA